MSALWSAWLWEDDRAEKLSGLLDRRLLSKAYGRVFLESLPACTVKRAPLAQIGAEAKAWLDKPR